MRADALLNSIQIKPLSVPPRRFNRLQNHELTQSLLIDQIKQKDALLQTLSSFKGAASVFPQSHLISPNMTLYNEPISSQLIFSHAKREELALLNLKNMVEQISSEIQPLLPLRNRSPVVALDKSELLPRVPNVNQNQKTVRLSLDMSKHNDELLLPK